MRTVMAGLLLVALAACGVGRHYRDAPENEPYATLTMNRESGTQTFMAFDNPDCYRSEGMGFMQTFGSLTAYAAHTKRNRLRPGARIFILSSTNQFAGTSGNQTGYAQCDNLSSFVPVASREYQVSHVLEGGVCRARIVEAGTGVVPETLQFHHVPEGCGRDLFSKTR